MKQTLAVHFQFMHDDGKIMKNLLNSKKNFVASIVPNLLDKNMKTIEGKDIHERIHPTANYYPEWAIESFRENKDNPNITWVQEGYRHCCNICFEKYQKNGGSQNKNAWPDPFHEHVCLDGYAQSLEEQVEVIKKGKKLIEDRLGFTPIGYCPPNHMYNGDTLKAVRELGFDYLMARNGFDYFMKGRADLPAYEDEGLVVIPESKIGTKSPIILTYYDHLEKQWNNFVEVLNSSFPFSELPVSEKPKGKVWASDRLITAYKIIRDLKKRAK